MRQTDDGNTKQVGLLTYHMRVLGDPATEAAQKGEYHMKLRTTALAVALVAAAVPTFTTSADAARRGWG